MKIAVAGFQHETNTFAAEKTDYAEFVHADVWPKMLHGPEIFEVMTNQNIPLPGFLSEAIKDSVEIVPILWCSATPSGTVTDEAYQKITTEIFEELEKHPDLDALYFDLHGAMVSENDRDADGVFLKTIRSNFPNVKIVISLDLHANISEDLFENCNQIAIYRTYPHVDMFETGQRAWHYLKKLLSNDAPRFQAMRKLPFLIPMTTQSTLSKPAGDIYAYLKRVEQKLAIDLDFAMGFPLADVYEVGPTLIAYGEEAAKVEEGIEELYQYILDKKSEFQCTYYSPQKAVAEAKQSNESLILVDTQDNPGCGGSSDSTGLLQAMMDGKLRDSIIGLIYDPEVAEAAHQLGAGQILQATLGGKIFTESQSVTEDFEILALSNGQFMATGPFYRNTAMDLGKMALLRANHVLMVVSSQKAQAADQAMFTHLGVNFDQLRVIALKSSVHYQADFNSISPRHLVVEAPGFNIADPKKLKYYFKRISVQTI